MNPREWHHYYLGILLCIVSVFVFTSGRPVGALIVFTLGGLIAIDDLIQEGFNVRTPLARLSHWLYQFEWARAIYEWFDNLFKRK
jgi:hypothetical protein